MLQQISIRHSMGCEAEGGPYAHFEAEGTHSTPVSWMGVQLEPIEPNCQTQNQLCRRLKAYYSPTYQLACILYQLEELILHC